MDQMPDFYESIDALIMPSLQEGAGLPAIEAAASGRLVIGTPVGHFPRLAYEGLGILGPLDEKAFLQFTVERLNFFKNNPIAYQHTCKIAQDAACERDWSKMVDDWIGLFSTKISNS
jgi:glycosyltransferase involved in cell wall biosynthesis